MKKIYTIIILAFAFVQMAFAGTVFTTKSNNGSEINLTDTKPCTMNGEVQKNWAISYIISSSDGKMSYGCWTIDNSTNKIMINWGEPGLYAYDIMGFDVTDYGQQYFKK